MDPQAPKMIALFERMKEGGNSQWFMNIIRKYGVVPASAMPATPASTISHSYRETLVRIINTLGVKIHQLSHHLYTQPELPALESQRLKEEIQTIKDRSFSNIKRILSTCLGDPPKTFNLDLGPEIHLEMTPFEFLTIVGKPLPETVTLYDIPHHPLPETGRRILRITGKRNLVEAPPFTALQLPTERIMSILRNTIITERHPVPVSVFHYGLDPRTNLYSLDHQTYPDRLLGIETEISKAASIAYGLVEAHRHILLLVGMDPEEHLREAPEEVPLEHRGPLGKFINSWAPEKQHLLCTQEWLQQNIYGAEIPVALLPEDLQHFLKTSTEDDVLPLDYGDAAARL